MKAMARDPRQRHDSARELARDLDQFAQRGAASCHIPAACSASRLPLVRPHASVRRNASHRDGDRGSSHDASFAPTASIAEKLTADFPALDRRVRAKPDV